MSEITDRDREFMAKLQEAIEWGVDYVLTIDEVGKAFDDSIAHVQVLLEDGVALFERGSFGTAAFLAITALEENIKAEILIYRARKVKTDMKKRGDPMQDHRRKHFIAVRATTFMGRLPGVLGAETCARLETEASTGVFNRERENALYVHIDKDGAHPPLFMISKERARELLLLSIEAADDALVGYSRATGTLEIALAGLWKRIV